MQNKFKKYSRSIIFLCIILIGIFFKSLSLVTDKLWIFEAWLPVIWWTLGMFIGWIISESDRFVDILYVNPETQLAVYVKRYLSERKYIKAWQLLIYNHKLQTRLTFHSALFQMVWLLIAFFTLSSTSSSFGKGFIIGLGLSILLKQWQDWFEDKSFLKKWLWWQFVRKFSTKDTYYYLLLITILSTLFWRWSLSG